jgi:hypothetical protein
VNHAVSTCDLVSDPRDIVASANGDAKSRHTIAVLEELLDKSICLRDLYRYARSQAAYIQYSRLHQLFDRHYKEQLHLMFSLIGFEQWRKTPNIRAQFSPRYPVCPCAPGLQSCCPFVERTTNQEAGSSNLSGRTKSST